MRKHMFATAGISLGITLSASGAIRYVDDSVSSSGNGTSWSLAYKTLPEALTVAGTGDEIRVGQGTYKPTADTVRSVSFVLKRVKVLGGWAGFGASNPDARDVDAFPTILSGDIGTADDYSDNSYHVVTASDTAMTPDNTLLDGVTITKGNGNGGDVNDCNDTTIDTEGGGGFFIAFGADPRLNNCRIIANRSGSGQGGDASSGPGGQILCASPILTKCIFDNNEPNLQGGNNGYSVIYGGGIVVRGGDPKIIDCVFRNNKASRGAGIAFKGDAAGLVLNTLVTGNVIVTGFGGSSELYNGAGVHFDRNSGTATTTIVNCTIADNDPSGNCVNGGGIAQLDGNSHTVSIHNTIVWNNHTTGSTGKEIYTTSGSMYGNYCCVKNRTSTTGVVGSVNWSGANIESDPNFVSSSDYHLDCDSDCIDGGDITSSTNPIPPDDYDVDGNSNTTEDTPDLDLLPRVVYWPDIGCYEHPPILCYADTDSDGIVDVEDLLLVLESWGTCGTSCPADIAPTRPPATTPAMARSTWTTCCS